MTNQKENSVLSKIWGLTQANSKELKTISGHVSVLNSEMGGVQKEIGEIKNSFVRVESFSPVQKIAYGLVGLILTAVIGAGLALILK